MTLEMENGTGLAVCWMMYVGTAIFAVSVFMTSNSEIKHLKSKLWTIWEWKKKKNRRGMKNPTGDLSTFHTSYFRCANHHNIKQECKTKQCQLISR